MSEQQNAQQQPEQQQPADQSLTMPPTWEKLFYSAYLPILAAIRKAVHDEDQAHDLLNEITVAILRSNGALKPWRWPRPEEIGLVDVTVPESGGQLSLLRLVGKPGKDVVGKLTREFGHVAFKITHVILNDGTEVPLEGEHDVAYVAPNEQIPGLDEQTLSRLWDQYLDS